MAIVRILQGHGWVYLLQRIAEELYIVHIIVYQIYTLHMRLNVLYEMAGPAF
jgi:hypothetical protein